MQRKHANTQKYSHAQWKIQYDQLQKTLQETTDQTQIQQHVAKIEALVAISIHYDYYYEPKKLVTSLTHDVEAIFNRYNQIHLINQSDEVRFCMLEISTLMHKIKQVTHRVKDRQLLETKCRQYYEQLFEMLEKHLVELKLHDKTLYEQFIIVFNKHDRTLPTVTLLTNVTLDRKDLDILHRAEKAAYQEALKNLRETLAQLPKTTEDIKKSGNDLINYIEAKRTASQKPSCFFKKTPFDYKRYTINLNSTTELLKSPFDRHKQNNYENLINSNTDENKTNNIARMMGLFFLGVLALAIGLVVVALSKGAIVPVIAGSVCMTSGAGVMGFSAFKHKFMPTTATHLSSVAQKTKEYTEVTNTDQCCL